MAWKVDGCGFESHLRQPIFRFGQVVLCCFAFLLLCCLAFLSISLKRLFMFVSVGNQGNAGMSGTGQDSRESTLERRKSEVNPDKRGGTPEPRGRRDTRSGSLSSTVGR